jgi:cytochrome P450
MPFVQDLMSGGKRIVLMGYTDQWRELRKVMHSILNSRQMTQFAEYQDLESKQLLWDYLKQPDLWFKANQRYANAVIMSVVFGRRFLIDDENLEPLLKQAEDMVNHLQPGSTLVDTFPVLSRLPPWMQWWRAKGLSMFEESKR